MKCAPNCSVQLLELKAVVLVFTVYNHCAFNLVCDSLYVASILERIEDAFLGKNSNVLINAELQTLANLINVRSSPYFSTHIRSHMSLPGFLSKGNAVIDSAVSAAVVTPNAFEAA